LGRRSSIRPAAAVLALLLLGRTRPTAAQEIVPAPLQAAIFTKVLAYDRALKARSQDAVRIGLVFKSEDKASTQAEADMRQAFGSLAAQTIQGMPIKVSSHPYHDNQELAAWIGRQKVDVLYLTPALRDSDYITALAREKKLITMSPVRKYVEAGVALGVLVRAESPRILVNLAMAQQVGMDLDPKLLQLSEVLR
jgi:hypothetical protein